MGSDADQSQSKKDSAKRDEIDGTEAPHDINGRDGIERLRRAVEQVDRDILRLVARRMELAASIGRVKVETGEEIRNPAVEQEVLRRGQILARELGIGDVFTQDLLRLLMGQSVATQEHLRTSRRSTNPRVIGIIGSSGGMGQWCKRQFSAAGHEVLGRDPVDTASPPLENLVQQCDVLILAVPLGDARACAQALLALRPHGVFFDICSVKGGLAADLRRAATQGQRVVSVHPMFGPEALPGRTVLISDCGHAEATATVRELFTDIAANLVDVPLEQHDALMATVLGMAHMTNLVFMHSVRHSGFDLDMIRTCAGTTFTAQLALAESVASESPALYHDIQRLNVDTSEMFQRMRESLGAFEAALGHPEKFAYLMKGQ
jgi:chorismate mutase/prephenate dehydrogenase